MNGQVSILVVEDDDLDLMTLQRALGKVGLDSPVFVAKDGVEALEMIRSENGHDELETPFLIILDLNMPRMNGFEFLEELRAHNAENRTPVFVMTTSASENDRNRAYDYQVAGYILKRRYGEELFEAVRMIAKYTQVNEFPA